MSVDKNATKPMVPTSPVRGRSLDEYLNANSVSEVVESNPQKSAYQRYQAFLKNMAQA